MDLCHELYDGNAVKHIDWSDCTTRRQELECTKVDRTWKADAAGYLRAATESWHGRAAVNDLLGFRQAMVRRAAALDISAVCSFEAAELWSGDLAERAAGAAHPGLRDRLARAGSGS